MLDYGQAVVSVPFVEAGALAVFSVAQTEARELYLYSLHAGQSCSLTMGCCIYRQPSRIKAVAEQPCRVQLVPQHYIVEWLDRYPSFRQFVYETMCSRIVELVQVVEAVAFHPLAERLERFLISKTTEKQSRLINLSHEQIAAQLGTARTVVSRLLKAMEHNGKVLLLRGQIKWMGDMNA